MQPNKVQTYRGDLFSCFVFSIRSKVRQSHLFDFFDDAYRRQGPDRIVDLYQRNSNRYELTAPVSYWWSSSKGPTHSGMGETRNISHCGVLVAAGECPPIGAAIQITVHLPHRRSPGVCMKLEGEGKVLRVENSNRNVESNPSRAFAASVQFYFETSVKREQLYVSGGTVKTTGQ